MPEQTEPTAPAAEGSGEPSNPTRQEQIRAWLEPTVAEPPPPVEAKEPEQPSPAPEPEPKTEADLSQADESEEPEADKLPKAIAKIRRLKDEKKTLKASLQDKDSELAELKSRLSELERKSAPEVRVDLSQETDVAVLEKRLQEATALYTWAEDTLDKVDVDDDPARIGAELEAEGLPRPQDGWTTKAIREQLVKLRKHARTVREQAPQRIEWLKTEDAMLARAMELAPELADSDSPLAQEVKRIVEAKPWMKQLPDWSLMATAGALGLQVLNERAKPKSKAEPKAEEPKARPVPAAPRLPGAPKAAASPTVDKLAELRKAAQAPGASPEARRAYIRATLG